MIIIGGVTPVCWRSRWGNCYNGICHNQNHLVFAIFIIGIGIIGIINIISICHNHTVSLSFRPERSRSPSSPLAIPIQAPSSPVNSTNRAHHGVSRASSVTSFTSDSNRSGQQTHTPSPLPSFGSGSDSENEAEDDDSQDAFGDNSNDA